MPAVIAVLLVLLVLPHNGSGFGVVTRTTRPNQRWAAYLSMMSDTPVETPTGGATILSCNGLSKSWVGTPQFQDISLKIGKGQRLGLIGVNGAGKSTLLKCLGKVDSPDSGTIETASNTNVIYVDQEPDWKGINVYEALFSGPSEEAKAVRDYYRLMDPNGSMDDDEFAKVTDDLSSTNGWDYQDRGLSISTKLNIPDNYFYRDVNSLSGGERKRVGLSAALLKQPDILLLDEPTNHLDIDALDWLADFLRPGGKDKDMAILLVTHDRYFLERVCSEIVELDRASLYRYPGNYARYLDLKAERLSAEDAEAQRARTKLRKESEWMARQPQGRQTKSKARQDQFYSLVDAAKGRKEASNVQFATAEEKAKQQRLGGVVSEFKKAKYLMGDRVLLEDFTYSFRARDRIGIVGPNGVGKSTFLKVLTGQLQLASGEIRLGETVQIGYYEQTGLVLTPEQEDQPILKFVQEAIERQGATGGGLKALDTKIVVQESAAPVGRRDQIKGKSGKTSLSVDQSGGATVQVGFSEREAMKLLTRFQFPSTRWYDKLGQMSGGERRRLQLLQVLASSPNVLLLDEPSNDLDLQTLTALEEFLNEVFTGCLVVVSHDNFFVNAVAEHLFVFEGDGVVRDFQGSYTDYLEYRKDKLAAEVQERKGGAGGGKNKGTKDTDDDSKVTTKASASSSNVLEAAGKIKEKGTPDNLSYNERKEFNKLTKEISKKEEQLAVLDKELLAAGATGDGFTVLAELTDQANKVRLQLSTKEERWMELMEKDA